MQKTVTDPASGEELNILLFKYTSAVEFNKDLFNTEVQFASIELMTNNPNISSFLLFLQLKNSSAAVFLSKKRPNQDTSHRYVEIEQNI